MFKSSNLYQSFILYKPYRPYSLLPDLSYFGSKEQGPSGLFCIFAETSSERRTSFLLVRSVLDTKNETIFVFKEDVKTIVGFDI